MKAAIKIFLILLSSNIPGFCWSQSYKPVIEWKHFYPADPRLIVKSGYLVVPENRQHPDSKKIKVAFIFLRRPDQSATKNVSLYTVGGPGYSTINGIDSMGYEFGYLKFGGTVMFDQRGTKMSEPCLACGEIDEAIRRSYAEGKSQDSLVLQAVKDCRKRLTGQGIDLSAYNTLEAAEDINDLRKTLGLDSLNLIGLSYSGGLMLTVARNHPEAVKTLILRSPLPGFVNYDESGLINFTEALEQVFENCRLDSASELYSGLKERFHQYFTSVTGKKFKLRYLPKSAKDSVTITYDKSDLLDVIDGMLSSGEVKGVPRVMLDLMAGKHQRYINDMMDGYYSGNIAISTGMRYSAFCSEQTDFANLALQKSQDTILPWLSGYRYNDVTPAICRCWNVPREPAEVKTPVFSSVPALIVGGDADPGCSIQYNRLIKRTLPNAQLLIRHNEGHGSGFKVNGVDYLEMFLAHPYQKLVSQSKDLRIE
ncbi:MAG TPA: alpha/beta fold hydrolase [Mucilaginibacter sp.]|jgi:pimeloyl-ACP methyl ester carboxylesterase|nr:alpha/beta fold hydrolase [Mucilaginibacter sp.]